MCKLGNELRKVKASKSNPFVCYRWFKVNESFTLFKVNESKDGFSLAPIFVTDRNPWKNKIAKAHDTPRTFTKIGLHAYATKAAALRNPADDAPEYILGRVLMWGECIEHEDGIRAEFAKIDTLYTSKNTVFGGYDTRGRFVHRKLSTVARHNPLLKKVKFCRLEANKVKDRDQFTKF